MAITDFRGEYKWLSNFGRSPFKYFDAILNDYVEVPTVEHAFQAAKTISKYDRIRVLEAPTPRKARNRGQQVPLRSSWELDKLTFMKRFVQAKFIQNPDLAKKLLETQNHHLIEENTWGDTFWGVCNGRGQNHLGRILMDTRNLL